ncbi:hypothetical protein [Rheinheimera nanhaiensis]|nr:hypothetical protein [Rheinheimera nanhaiensis]
MSDNLRYGTENNPIRLIQDNSFREMASRCPRIATGAGIANIDLGKIRGDENTDPFLIYVMNLISNPNIDDKAVRLGCWLYSDSQLSLGDVIYDLTDIGKRPSLRFLGDEDYIYVGNPTTQKYQYYEKKFPKLIKELSDIDIEFTRDELINSISNLHEFYYITATDICPINSFLETKSEIHTKKEKQHEKILRSEKYIGKQKKVDSSTSLAHIHITTSLTNKSIAGKWTPFVEPSSKKPDE